MIRFTVLRRAAALLALLASPLAAQLPSFVTRDSSVLFRSTTNTDRRWHLQRGKNGELRLFGKELNPSVLPIRKRLVANVAFNRDSSRLIVEFANDMPRRVEIDTAALGLARVLFGAPPNRDSLALINLRATYDANATESQVKRWTNYGDALGTISVTGTTFQSKQWLLFGPLYSDSSYNRVALDAPARLARVALSEMPLTLKAAGLGRVADVSGIALSYRIRHYDPLSLLKQDSFDETRWYFPMDAVRRFIDAEITVQALYRESIILLNGNRIEIDYNARAR